MVIGVFAVLLYLGLLIASFVGFIGHMSRKENGKRRRRNARDR
jgi:hypothetical protein